MTPEDLNSIASAPEYNRFVDQPNTKKERPVQEPVGATMRLHYRLVKLLDSVERPKFLHSATRRRSYITNAAAHRSGAAIVQTDIRKFYESTTYAHVKAFFLKDLGWPHDLAKLIAQACTVDGHLPTGSCISPLLSFFIHREMFLEIQSVCDAASVTMTLYVDDLTLSGAHATRTLLFKVKALVKLRDLPTHKEKYVAPGHVGLVTGVAVQQGNLRLRNKQRKGMVDMIDSIRRGDESLVKAFNGKLAAAEAVDPSAAAGLRERLERQIIRPSRSATEG